MNDRDEQDHRSARTIQPGDVVAVTGAAGFIGSAITRQLLARGAEVVALVEPGSDEGNLEGLAVERRPADVRDVSGLRPALQGCRYLFHTAALYGFWASDPHRFYDVNVRGTRNVLEAAAEAGCQRIVYTSTVGTIGVRGTAQGIPADEDCHAEVHHLFGPYKRSKYVAEHEVLRAAAQGAPVALALPTFPLGPRDRRPTPTGKLVLDFLNGRMPGYVDTAMNVAHVDDLAAGHLLVLEQGRTGRSYILGGENLTMQEILTILAEVTGLPLRSIRFPRAMALGAGMASEWVEGRLLGRQPSVPLEAARMSSTHMIFDDRRARTELGYRSRPPEEAIEESARWFVDHGYVAERRRRRLHWAPRADDLGGGTAGGGRSVATFAQTPG
jgi:dihydroflavonol-4-reductase